MKKFDLKDLSKEQNLRLAWQRILTGSNRNYKQLSSEVYNGFNWNSLEKLKLLSKELEEDIYEPGESSKFFIPKSSGLVRPITVLNVKDQIIYQAIANLACQSKLNDIKFFRGKCVFGGFNVSKPKSEYFLSYWPREYENYKESIKEAHKNGYEWVCKFDLASFYDVIDHHILTEVVFGINFENDITDLLKKCLDKWCKPEGVNFIYSQGIPQGPLASQAFADIYLHHLDEKMQKLALRSPLCHFRYVDDIVLMSNNRRDLDKGLCKLDIVARELSLVPQSSKIEISNPEDIQDILKAENSLIDQYLSFDDEDRDISVLEKLFRSSYKETTDGEINIIDQTSFKFSLYRLPPLNFAKDVVLNVIEKYYTLTDICIYYLNKFEEDESILERLTGILRSKPIHDWSSAKILEYKSFLNHSNIEAIIPFAFSSLEDPEIHWILKRNILAVIKRSARSAIGIIDLLEKNLATSKVSKQLPYFIALLEAAFETLPDRTIQVFAQTSQLNTKMCDDLNLLFGYLSKDTGLDFSELPVYSNWIFVNYPINDVSAIDGLATYFVEFFELPSDLKVKVDFRSYLGEEDYGVAIDHARKAKGYYEADPELFILHTDALHQIILAKIICQDSDEKRKYEMGNLVGTTKNLVPKAYSGLSLCHDFRCESDKTHAFNQTNKSINKKKKQQWYSDQNMLFSALKVTYKYLIEHIASAQIQSE